VDREFQEDPDICIALFKILQKPPFQFHSEKRLLCTKLRKGFQMDNLIKTYSETIDWDWRLVAALIYQESRFLPDVVSRVGAYGLMQVMPETGRNFGIDITSSPENNIRAGIKFIGWLHKIFDPLITDKNERTKFILASYNAGPGHVLDAMKLAEKNGMDPRNGMEM